MGIDLEYWENEDNFNEFEPEIVFDKNNVIFFDNKGSIIKFNEQSKIIWKKNYYSKTEKKMKPVPSGKKGKGLRKLPKAVRNKMGFMKKGGRVKKRKK